METDERRDEERERNLESPPDNESDDMHLDEEEEPTKSFRLQSQTLFLTYSQCPLPKEHVLEALQWCLKIRDYIVAEERHADGNSHIHCYLKLLQKLHLRDGTWFDLVGLEGEIYHPNIQSVRSPTAVQKYCTKEGNYLTNLTFYAGMLTPRSASGAPFTTTLV